ncbi:OV-16 antigen-like isoform X2 [Bemisia tabaci]|uniref:OV-16 antigen-like isoform X2 n=1 Tax=Bemisia tabaci TaxID=7038 RepID=UPI003B27D109
MVPIRKLNTPIGVRKIIFIVVSLEIISVFVESSELDNYVSELLKKTKIIPDVLDVAPKYALDVRYGTQAIKFGTLLPPTFVHEAPSFVDWKHGPKTYFTLIMTDPDSPATSNPYNREWQHWVVGNIPTNNVGAGKVLTPYLGAIHPKEDDRRTYSGQTFQLEILQAAIT